MWHVLQSLKAWGRVLKEALKPQPNQMETTQRLRNLSGVIPAERGKGPKSRLLNYLGSSDHDSSGFLMKAPKTISNHSVALLSSSSKLFGLWSWERGWGGPFSLCDGKSVLLVRNLRSGRTGGLDPLIINELSCEDSGWTLKLWGVSLREPQRAQRAGLLWQWGCFVTTQILLGLDKQVTVDQTCTDERLQSGSPQFSLQLWL